MKEQLKLMNRMWVYLAVIGGVLIGGTTVYLFKDKLGVDSNAVSMASNAQADAATATSAAGIGSAERKATEAIVRAYILENPEIITQAVEILQKREVTARIDSVGDTLGKPYSGAIAGNPDGDVTVVKFTDYNCGYCRASLAEVDKLISKDKGVKIVYREVPILSESSKTAALWALAAAKQGKYLSFHRAMFKVGDASDASIKSAAKSAGIDMLAAQKVVASDEANEELKQNVEMMQQLGFNGTPTFIIGGQIMEGLQEYKTLQTAVDQARKAKG
jgi:protein-disulfide isomerase